MAGCDALVDGDSAVFPLTPHPAPTSDLDRARLLEAPVFGKVFSDHMARATWRRDVGWSDRGVVPLAPLPMHPGAAVLHYGQEVFEGLKAYRWADGSVHLFRPEANAARLAASARRLAMPEVSEDDFIASLTALVRADAGWVPSTPGSSLYLRPNLFANEVSLLVQAADTYEYVVTASPVGGYFAAGAKAVSIWVAQGYHRANLGGTGEAKTGGNYAASLLPTQQAYANGCSQVLFLDARTDTYIEELGGMNVVLVLRDGSVVTPRLGGTILHGITRDSVLTLLRADGREVIERDVELSELVEGIASGQVVEVFAVGTAAVVVPVGRLLGEGLDAQLGEPGRVAADVLRRLTDIQYGRADDEYGWTRRVA